MVSLSIIKDFVKKIVKHPIKAGIATYLIYNILKDEDEDKKENLKEADTWDYKIDSDGAHYTKSLGDEKWFIHVKGGRVVSAKKQIHGDVYPLNPDIVQDFKKKMRFENMDTLKSLKEKYVKKEYIYDSGEELWYGPMQDIDELTDAKSLDDLKRMLKKHKVDATDKSIRYVWGVLKDSREQESIKTLKTLREKYVHKEKLNMEDTKKMVKNLRKQGFSFAQVVHKIKNINNWDEDETEQNISGYYYNVESYKEFKMGDKVKVHPSLTTDPYNKRGEVGTIVKFSPEGDIFVKFSDGKTGIYETDAVVKA